MAKHQYLFVAYHRGDQDRVLPVVDAVRKELEFRAVPIKVWMDVSNLIPGENWDSAISDALKSSVGFLFFVSPQSLQSKWIRRELQIATTTTDRLLIPVILHRQLDMPPELERWQSLDLSGRPAGVFGDAPVFMCCKRKQIVLLINNASQSPHRCPGCLAPCHLPWYRAPHDLSGGLPTATTFSSGWRRS